MIIFVTPKILHLILRFSAKKAIPQKVCMKN
jgi:hypothetical protein